MIAFSTPGTALPRRGGADGRRFRAFAQFLEPVEDDGQFVAGGLISRPALRLLSASELQAAVAHEIGHEYFWSQYGNARLAGNPAGQQTLELKCDGIAALTLLALGLDVSRLSSAIRRMIEFNETLGATAHTRGYPTVRERERFVRTLLKTTAGHRK